MAKRLPPRDPKTGRFVKRGSKRGSKRTRRKAGRRRKGKR